MTAKFTMTGGKELEEALKELGNQIAGRLGNNAVRAGARVIAAEARARAPVATGALRKSIKVVGDAEERRLGGTTRTAYVVARAPHAHLVEKGTLPRRQASGRYTGAAPAKAYLRPSLDTQGQAAVDKMGQNLGAGIEREAAKLGKK
jgi:HK97 gp10 family phage protein